jgi:hypothetical protein
VALFESVGGLSSAAVWRLAEAVGLVCCKDNVLCAVCPTPLAKCYLYALLPSQRPRAPASHPLVVFVHEAAPEEELDGALKAEHGLAVKTAMRSCVARLRSSRGSSSRCVAA